MSDISLIADIGATNVRFAISHDDTHFDKLQILKCKEFATLNDAINEYLRTHSIGHIKRACLAVAGPLINNQVDVTNNHWVIDRAQLLDVFQLKHLLIINDFEAIAYSLPGLSNYQLFKIGTDQWHDPKPTSFTYLVLGPGSGLGVAALIKKRGQLTAVVTEAGHVNFSPVNEIQSEILTLLKNKHATVSNEMLLSGPGLENIYSSICQIHGQRSSVNSAAKICECAAQATDQLCVTALRVFFEILAQVAGDLTLSFAAFNGVFIAGGIVPRHVDLINQQDFRHSFQNKSQHSHLLNATPIAVIKEPYPGLIGAQNYMNQYE